MIKAAVKILTVLIMLNLSFHAKAQSVSQNTVVNKKEIQILEDSRLDYTSISSAKIHKGSSYDNYSFENKKFLKKHRKNNRKYKKFKGQFVHKNGAVPVLVEFFVRGIAGSFN